jgi:hypothetical protein
LIPGLPGGARTGFDSMIKADAILNVAIRDGPLSNFSMLGRLSFDIMVSDESDLTSDDTKKLSNLLERMLYTPAAPFANSSKDIWTRFDHLFALVRDPALLGGTGQSVERLRPLLDMIEEVVRIRPPADKRGEGTGNVDNQTHPDGSADLETHQLGGPPIPGSSRQVGASHMERGGPVATSFPPFPGTIPLAEMPRIPPRGRSSRSPSDLDLATIDDSTSSAELDSPQLGMAPIPGSSRQVEAWHPGVGGPSDLRLAPSVHASILTAGMDPFAPRGWTRGNSTDFDPVSPRVPPISLIPAIPGGPRVPQMHPLAFPPSYIPSLGGPRRAFSLDTANLPVQALTQSVLTDIPLPPRHMLPHPSPYSSSSPGPFDVPQLGHGNQGGNESGRVPVVRTGAPQIPDPNSRASTYLFLPRITVFGCRLSLLLSVCSRSRWRIGSRSSMASFMRIWQRLVPYIASYDTIDRRAISIHRSLARGSFIPFSIP